MLARLMISIIIPVLNDVRGLRQTLASLVTEKEGHEVLVVDGGSIDGSTQLARETSWAKLVKADGGKGACLNAGTVAAKGDILMFLYPGTSLERGWSKAVEQAAAAEGFGLGCFKLHVDSSNPLYRLIDGAAWLRTKLFQLPRAGQAMFVKRDNVEQGRAFLDLPAFEDLDLARRLKHQGKVVQLPLAAINTVHRWTWRGPVHKAFADAASFWKLLGGAQPSELARFGDEPHEALVMFVKNPVPGDVKPWLNDVVGEERAARIYRRSIEEILNTAQRAHVEAKTYVFYRPQNGREDMHRWLGDRAMLVAQKGRNNSDRRAHALDLLFERAVEKAVLLGNHCPAMTDRHITEAVYALERADVVVGPTDDGGCYLVGIHRKHRDLLVDLAWEPDGLYEELTDVLNRERIGYVTLDTLHDFDSVDDLTYNYGMGYVQD